MIHKTEKLVRFSLVVAVFYVIVALAWPSGVVFAQGQLGTAVLTQNGLVLGADDDNQTWCWKGIPFAQPPVGALRWKAPQPVGNWGELDATAFGPQCPQYNVLGTLSGSEDCLYLNVWRPATQEGNLPVYVWIHGGGNSIGTADDPLFDMDKFASRTNMVVVTIQYRLGPLGWFIHPSLQDGDRLDNSGNYGTLDIIQALRWIRVNSAAFGGNPENVTIAGESAGARNVCTLIISPAAKGLFHKAISESGRFTVNSVEAGIASADVVIDRMIANDELPGRPEDLAGYLRDKSPEEIFGVYGSWVGGLLSTDDFKDMFTDGVVIHADGQTALFNPKSYNPVPTILGTNKEEMKLFLFPLYGTMPDEDYQAKALAASTVWQTTGVNAPAFAMSTNKAHPGVYAYQFNYGAYNKDGYNAWLPPYDIMIGAAHGLEMPFIFGTWRFMFFQGSIFRPDNLLGRQALNDAMVAYWASFARTGTPGESNGILWKPWSNKVGGPKRILFDADTTQSIITMITK